MSMEDEIKAIVANIQNSEGWGSLGKSPAEAHVERNIEGIWDALLILARDADARTR